MFLVRLGGEGLCFVFVFSSRTRHTRWPRDWSSDVCSSDHAGIPMGVKELAQVQGWPDTNASVPYAEAGAVAEFDCAEVARLRDAGAVLVGLPTAPEHGVVSYTASKLHGVTRNPWNLERTPGGSSGGSAAAVAAGLFPACTGSDGGGSIRIPASYSGLPGMKTTFGFTGTGPGPYNFSLNSVRGPMVRSVRDAARYLDVIGDPTSLPESAVSFEHELVSGAAIEALRGKRVGWSATLGYASTDRAVEQVAREAADALIDAAGVELVDVDPVFPKPGTAWTVLSTINDMASHYEDMCDRRDELTD